MVLFSKANAYLSARLKYQVAVRGIQLANGYFA